MRIYHVIDHQSKPHVLHKNLAKQIWRLYPPKPRWFDVSDLVVCLFVINLSSSTTVLKNSASHVGSKNLIRAFSEHEGGKQDDGNDFILRVTLFDDHGVEWVSSGSCRMKNDSIVLIINWFGIGFQNQWYLL